MIAAIRGTVWQKTPEYVVVDCQGVGYRAYMSLTSLSRMGAVGSEVTLWVHTHVGPEVLRLFGFLEESERHAFEVLIGISRVGPKLALAILSVLSATELGEVVARNDLAAFGAVPGVGKKTAERLLLELRGRWPASGASVAAPGEGSLREDLVSALVNLGFKELVAQRAAQDAARQLPQEQDLATLIREALRATTRR